jgi:hypothetical protein
LKQNLRISQKTARHQEKSQFIVANIWVWIWDISNM